MASLAKISYFLTPSPLQLCIYHCSSIVTSLAHRKTNYCPGNIKGQAGPEETAVKLIFFGEGEIKLGHPSNFGLGLGVFLGEDFSIQHVSPYSGSDPRKITLAQFKNTKSLRTPRASGLHFGIISHTGRNSKTLLSNSHSPSITHCKSDHSRHVNN